MRTLGIAVVLGLMVGCGAASSPSAKAPSAPEAGSGVAGPSGYAVADSAKESAAVPGYPRAPAAAGPAAAGDYGAPAAPPPPPSMAPSPSVAPMEGAASGAAVNVAPRAADPGRPVITHPRAGQLTAGVWDDNRNFDFWKPYASGFATNNGSDFVMFTAKELEEARVAASAQQAPRTELDVQLVLDTTGSMGDELTYLQSEFDAIATQVRTKFPDVTPRWSLVVYKDKGDEYVAKGFDFTTDTNKFRSSLRAQSAGGGGDTPEAVVEGLSTGLAQQWRNGTNVAKLAFWVADAPAHPGEGPKLGNVIRDAKKKGVHIYPVASSDADDAAEYQMRSAAQMTAGRYVFLTNDSGVGNSHAEPHIPCYNVSRLDHAIVRMIQVEMSGRFVDADAREVMRSVGQPNKDGQCKLASGMLVASY